MGVPRLSSYPHVVVRVACTNCPRRGAYRLARLAALLGPETALIDVLARLSSDCPKRDVNRHKDAYSVCGAMLPDLIGNTLPNVASGDHLARQRLPPREDLPQPRRDGAAGKPIPNAIAPKLVAACTLCGRREALQMMAIKALVPNGDPIAVAVHRMLTRSCPRARAGSADACGVRLEREE